MATLSDDASRPQALTDLDGCVLQANPAFASVADLPHAHQLVGRGVCEVLGAVPVPLAAWAQRTDVRVVLHRLQAGQPALAVSVRCVPSPGSPRLLVEVVGGGATAGRGVTATPRPAALRTTAAEAEDARGVVLMSAVASALADAASLPQVVDVVTRDLPLTLGADAVHLEVVDHVPVTCTDGAGAGVAGPMRVPAISVRELLAEARRTGHPLGVTSLSSAAHADGDGGKGPETWVVLPLRVDGQTVGAWALRYRDPQRVPVACLSIFGALSELCGQALTRARRWDQTRAVGLSLQRALAPSVPRDVHGLTLLTRYLPGDVGAEVGGDFFVVLPLAGDRAVVALGDVAGHGPQAGAGMSHACATLRAYALDGHPPSGVIGRTSAVLLAEPEPPFVTCCYGEVDVTNGHLRLVMAGHLPPLLLRADGRVDLLGLPVGPPMGVTEAQYVETLVGLAPGDALLMYTDGLVESRDMGLTEGLSALLRGARMMSAAGPAALVDYLLTSVRPRSSTDDAAVLLVRYDGL